MYPLQISASQQLHHVEAPVAESTCPSGFCPERGLQDHSGVNSEEFLSLLAIQIQAETRAACHLPLRQAWMHLPRKPFARLGGDPRGAAGRKRGVSRIRPRRAGRRGDHEGRRSWRIPGCRPHNGLASGPTSGRRQSVRIVDPVCAVRREDVICPEGTGTSEFAPQRAPCSCDGHGGQVCTKPNQDLRARVRAEGCQANRCQFSGQRLSERVGRGPREGREEGGTQKVPSDDSSEELAMDAEITPARIRHRRQMEEAQVKNDTEEP